MRLCEWYIKQQNKEILSQKQKYDTLFLENARLLVENLNQNEKYERDLTSMRKSKEQRKEFYEEEQQRSQKVGEEIARQYAQCKNQLIITSSKVREKEALIATLCKRSEQLLQRADTEVADLNNKIKRWKIAFFTSITISLGYFLYVQLK